MRFRISVALLFVSIPASAWAQEVEYPGTRSEWHGFARWDFELDGHTCRVVAPATPAEGRPWVWRARFPDWHPEADRLLLARGYHVAYIDVSNLFGNAEAVARFFEELLPKAVVQSAEKFLAQDGTIAIAVQPHGRWTVRFGSLEDPVSEGFDQEADLRVWFAPGAFARFVEGTLDVEEAVSSRQIKLAGDIKLMPGTGSQPSYRNIDVDVNTGRVTGLS